MTTAAILVHAALRESNLIGVNATPTDAQAAEGLARLNGVYLSLFGFEAGDALFDATPVATGAESPNTRVICDATTTSLTAPDNPADGCRFGVVPAAATTLLVAGGGRGIDGGSEVSVTAATEFFYRADLGQWLRVAPLAAADSPALPERYDDALITMAAMRLNPRYGRSMTPESQAALDRSMTPESQAALDRSITQMRAQYEQAVSGADASNALNAGERWSWWHMFRPSVQVYPTRWRRF